MTFVPGLLSSLTHPYTRLPLTSFLAAGRSAGQWESGNRHRDQPCSNHPLEIPSSSSLQGYKGLRRALPSPSSTALESAALRQEGGGHSENTRGWTTEGEERSRQVSGASSRWLSPSTSLRRSGSRSESSWRTEQSCRALPCFIVWAGPDLIPRLHYGLSGAHIEGPCCVGREAGRPSPPGLQRV